MAALDVERSDVDEAAVPPGPSTVVHVINHTHWDREWFLTAEYTTRWIPHLVDAIAELGRENPHYRYLFDGQTLAIEDLLALDADYRPTVDRLVEAGTLSIGPIYSQPDWRLTGGELLARNLQHGLADVADHGGQAPVAWLVDTFGHISQAPQLLSQAGIDAVYVWRGVPRMEPVFRWRSPDGTAVTAVNLFGGYRNLYGVSRTPSLGVRRLTSEVAKLAPWYGEVPIPLFDGYDLETEPEDPIGFYRRASGVPSSIELVESSPADYVRALGTANGSRPEISGELLSGRYGATFPGSLSTRTYLKVLHADCEHLLHAVTEPLAVMARAAGGPYRADRYERWDRELLQNAVHDCICGVSIDQVHERMERSYRRLLRAMRDDAEASIASVAGAMADGAYVLATGAVPSSGSVRVGDEVWSYRSEGVGWWPVSERHPVRTDDRADEAPVRVDDDGVIHLGEATIGPLVVTADHGDTYSSEPGAVLATAVTTDHSVESTSAVDAVHRVDLVATWAPGDEATTGGSVEATVRVRTSASATAELTIDLDSTGTDFVVELLIDTGVAGQPVAGMPLDRVARPHADEDLLGADIDPELGRVLMGQREVDRVSVFPFHDDIAISDGDRTAIVHARGLRSYTTTPDGQVRLALRRSVEWLAKSGLAMRAGDAGPAMYVPGARCERSVRHLVGLTVVEAGVDDPAVIAAGQAFAHPPIPIEVGGSAGSATAWPVVGGTSPLSSLVADRSSPTAAIARFYNPTDRPVDGGDHGPLQPHEIATRSVAIEAPAVPDGPPPDRVMIDWSTVAADRGGRSRTRPDPAVVHSLQERSDELLAEAAELEAGLSATEGDDAHRLQHRIYVLEREGLELALSAELNRRRLADPEAEVSIPDRADDTIAAIGERLNELRIMRRIYDYVADVLAAPPTS